jgi:RimJ/RimL family protein N-acetyltransferase
MSWGPNDERATREFLEKTTSASRAEPRTSWELAIVLCETGALIGGCGLMPSRPPYREWELGYVLRPELWGQGIVSEAARAVLDFGFRRVGAHRVFARIDPENAASIRVAGKLGMRHEGTWRRDSLIRGEWRDTRVYALLDEEWEGLREAR